MLPINLNSQPARPWLAHTRRHFKQRFNPAKFMASIRHSCKCWTWEAYSWSGTQRQGKHRTKKKRAQERNTAKACTPSTQRQTRAFTKEYIAGLPSPRLSLFLSLSFLCTCSISLRLASPILPSSRLGLCLQDKERGTLMHTTPHRSTGITICHYWLLFMHLCSKKQFQRFTCLVLSPSECLIQMSEEWTEG